MTTLNIPQAFRIPGQFSDHQTDLDIQSNPPAKNCTTFKNKINISYKRAKDKKAQKKNT